MPIPLKGSRWGILGGRFDPVHFGHLTLATEARRLQKLSGVLLVPSQSHAIKQSEARASFADRVEMLRLAIAPYNFLEISPIEALQNLSGYTLDTVKAIKQQYTGTEFFFIIGADNLTKFEKWHRPKEILKEIAIIVGARPDHDLTDIKRLPADRVIKMESALVNVSSTMVRDRLATASDYTGLSDLMPPQVIEYIKRRNLYR